MKQNFIEFTVKRSGRVKTTVIVLLIAGLLPAFLSIHFVSISINKSTQSSPMTMFTLNSQKLFVPTVTPSATGVSSNSALSSPNSQNDSVLGIAEFVIYWSGAFLTLVTVLLAIAAFFGIIEFRSTRRLREVVSTQVSDLLVQVADLKKQVEETERQAIEVATHAENQLAMLVKKFESDSQKLMDVTYTFTEANIAYNIGNNKRAIDYFLRVLDLQPDNLRVMERLGRAYSNLNQLPEATLYLKKAIDKDPNNVPALRSLGLCYRYQNPTEAINIFQQALTIDPDDYESWDFLGLIYRDQKIYEKAIDAHEKALKLKRRPETEFYLSILYFLTGDTELGRLMALNAENDLKDHEHQERIRPVWKTLINSAVPIIDGNEHEAFRLIQTLKPYITSNRIHDGVVAHLEILLTVTGHNNWISKFTNILEVKER